MMMGRSSLEGRVQSALRGNRRKLCAMIGRPRYVRAIAGGFHPRRAAAYVRGHALAQKLSKNGLLYAMKVGHCIRAAGMLLAEMAGRQSIRGRGRRSVVIARGRR